MASEKLQVILELVTGQYKKEAREAATATGQIGSAARTSTSGIGGLQGGLNLLKGAIAAVGVATITGQLREMADAAAEDAEAQEVLAGALRTNTGATDDQIEANERWISSMQIATRTADNDLRQAITDLTVSGRSLEEAQKDIAVAIDIAASKGIALDSVIKGLVRSLGSGSTAGLARLGIATKNAAGEMLSYDEVLQNAAKTMGGTAARAAGTLAGALERSKIAMEEAKEEAGAGLLPPLVALTDGFNQLVIGVLGGDKALARLQTTFNSVITAGIDPFEDAVATAGFVMVDFVNSMRIPLDDQTFVTLITMLGLTTDQVIQLRSNLILNGAAVVKNEEDLANLVGVLDNYVGNVDPAILATRRYQQAQQDAAGATRDYTGALQAQRDLLRELTDPLFALITANERYEDAQRRLNDVTIEGQEGSREYEDALAGLIRAQIDLNQAQADANVVGSDGLELLRQYAIQAGINEDAFDRWARSVDNLAGSIASLPSSIGGVNTITGNPKKPGAFAEGGSFSSGPIIVGEKGPEMLWPSQSGSVLSNSDMMKALAGGGGLNIVVQSPMGNFRQDLQYAAILASVTNLVEAL